MSKIAETIFFVSRKWSFEPRKGILRTFPVKDSLTYDEDPIF